MRHLLEQWPRALCIYYCHLFWVYVNFTLCVNYQLPVYSFSQRNKEWSLLARIVRVGRNDLQLMYGWYCDNFLLLTCHLFETHCLSEHRPRNPGVY